MTGLLVVHSSLEKSEDAAKRVNKNVEQVLNKNKSLKFLGYCNDVEKSRSFFLEKGVYISSVIIFVSSGGTEEIIDSIISQVKKPVLLWAYPKRNSLAASMEVYSVLKESFSLKLFYASSIKELNIEILKFIKVTKAIEKINSANLGMIGEPSGWLLTSKNKTRVGNFFTNIVKININEISTYVNKVDEEDGLRISDTLRKKFSKTTVTNKELCDSSKVYLALKELIKVKKLDSLTVKCFDLLKHNYTACMGLSMCNDENIVAGCEGDLLTTFTMMIGSYITENPCWMANPSSIDKKSNLLVLAHCTIPTKMLADLSESELVSHMESELSTAIQGPLKRGEVTIFRVGGNFDKMLCITGRIIETDMKDKSLCRTQAVIALEGDIDLWLEHSVGNHQVLVYGDITEELRDFCKYTNIKFDFINSQS